MNKLLRAISFSAFFVSGVNADSNKFVGYWKSKKLDSQFGRMVVTYAFRQDATFDMYLNFPGGWMPKWRLSGNYTVDSENVTMTPRLLSMGGMVSDESFDISDPEISSYKLEGERLVIDTSDGRHVLRKVDEFDNGPKQLPKFDKTRDIHITYYSSAKDSKSFDINTYDHPTEIWKIRSLIGDKILHRDGVQAGKTPYWLIRIVFQKSGARLVYVDEAQIMGIQSENSSLYEHLIRNYTK